MPAAPELLGGASAAKAADLFAGRETVRGKFLAQNGWADAQAVPVGEDCAYRRYFRLKNPAGKTAILMEALPDDHPVATPGHNIADFIRLGSWLKGQGINTPEIYQADRKSGYVLLEDFGAISFKQALAQGGEAKTLYRRAADVLVRLVQLTDLPELPAYRGSHVDRGRSRVVDWYMPVVTGMAIMPETSASYAAVWTEIESQLPPCPTGFVHIDFHVENLMWLPERKGLAQCGVLDFQGAMSGPLVYDLANLLEDPRQDIPPALREEIFSYFSAALPPPQQELIRAWYRVLATQFHCRVIGQFIKLALRSGKPGYLPYVPRLEDYLRAGLEDPVLAPLKSWFLGRGIDFTSSLIDLPDNIDTLIAADAF